MNKKLTIFDTNGGIGNILKHDHAVIKGTDIILKSLDNGKVLFRGSNKVIVSGSEFNAIKDFDYDKFVGDSEYDFLPSIPSYDMAFKNANKPFKTNSTVEIPINTSDFATNNFNFYTGEDTDVGSILGVFKNLSISDEASHRLYRQFARRVCLWCVGIDGCGIEASRVFKVHNTKWIAPYGYWDYNDGTGGNNTYPTNESSELTCLIPFKYRTTDADLQDSYRKQYFGRMQTSNSIAYFFKTFDEMPKLIRRYADDSTDLVNVSSDGIDVWKDKRASEAEVVVQLKMSVTASDCREYFNRTVGTNDSKINTISLCTAIPYLSPDGRLEYCDIRPFTRFNFPNEALIDYSKGINITYYLYY